MKAARLSTGTVRIAVAVTVPVLLAGLTSCSSADGDGAAAGTPRGTAGSTAAGTASSAQVAAEPFGPGCGLFAADGPGSLAALAGTPTGTALNAVPDLSTLTQAMIAANLVDVLNTRPDVTVLAPSDAAFDALGPEGLPALLADVPRLTTVLTHHVLNGRLTPDQLVGEHVTLNGDSITVAGRAEGPSVAADQTVAGSTPAGVVCGNVPTANATVYVVDQVLSPAG